MGRPSVSSNFERRNANTSGWVGQACLQTTSVPSNYKRVFKLQEQECQLQRDCHKAGLNNPLASAVPSKITTAQTTMVQVINSPSNNTPIRLANKGIR